MLKNILLNVIVAIVKYRYSDQPTLLLGTKKYRQLLLSLNL